MALTRFRIKTMLTGLIAVSGFAGCNGAASLVRDDHQKVKTTEVASIDPMVQPNLVRAQAPEVLPPVRIGRPQPDVPGRATIADPIDVSQPPVPMATMPPAPNMVRPASNRTPVAANGTPTVGEEGDTQVRIVASIGNNPIYESEVKEAVYQRLGDLLKLSDADRQVKQREMFREELRRIIERELVLEDMISTLTTRKQTAALNKLKEAASKDADAMLKMFKKERGVESDEDFRMILRSQGLTISGIRRQIERGTMMRIYMQEKVSRSENISLAEIREFYQANNSKEMQAEDSVKWQDLFVMTNKFPSPAEAKNYAMQLHAQVMKGEAFGPLAKKYGHGDSALRDGAGIGEKPGEIFPPDVEPTVLKLKAGQSTILETENGYHIIKVNERTVAGRRPLDEKLQNEIKRKIQAQNFEREAKRYIDTLWKRVQPQIWIDL